VYVAPPSPCHFHAFATTWHLLVVKIDDETLRERSNNLLDGMSDFRVNQWGRAQTARLRGDMGIVGPEQLGDIQVG
jgi:hypothetical protein